ncbi:MAG: N-formylglutamate amidohydrolase [Sedimentitalea sp.]
MWGCHGDSGKRETGCCVTGGALVQPALLSPDDPAPVEWCNRASASAILLLCEHAGQAVPQALAGLGVAPDILQRHIGWDIGAEALARAISDHLNAPLILQRYSRLVIDCNRPPGTPQSIPTVSDGVEVPGNVDLNAAQHDLRRRAMFDPMNAAIISGFETHPRRAAFSIHSFTRDFGGQTRIWDAGFLTRKDEKTARQLLDHIAKAAPQMRLGLNEPYQIDDTSDWFIPHHAEPRGVAHTLIEVCNDQLQNPAGIALWAGLLANAITATLEETP